MTRSEEGVMGRRGEMEEGRGEVWSHHANPWSRERSTRTSYHTSSAAAS